MSMSAVMQYAEKDDKLPSVTVQPVDTGRFASVQIGQRNAGFSVYVAYTDCRTFAARLEVAAATLRTLAPPIMRVVPAFRLARDECGRGCPGYQRGYEDRGEEDDERQLQERD